MGQLTEVLVVKVVVELCEEIRFERRHQRGPSARRTIEKVSINELLGSVDAHGLHDGEILVHVEIYGDEREPRRQALVNAPGNSSAASWTAKDALTILWRSMGAK